MKQEVWNQGLMQAVGAEVCLVSFFLAVHIPSPLRDGAEKLINGEVT